MVRSKNDVQAVLDMACIYKGKTVIAVKCSVIIRLVECINGSCVFKKDKICNRGEAKGMHIRECSRIDDDTAIYFKYLEDYDKE